MSDIFIKKDAWLEFAQEHNKTAAPNAVLLTGSQSYTRAACYLAAGVTIPSSIRLDTERATDIPREHGRPKRGQGVGNHFSGLRAYYETGVALKSWLPRLMAEIREFAEQHSVDPDDLIKKIIGFTDKDGRVRIKPDPRVLVRNSLGPQRCLPSREDFEEAYRRVAGLGERVALGVVLDEMEALAATTGVCFQENWRELIKGRIKTWTEKGE